VNFFSLRAASVVLCSSSLYSKYTCFGPVGHLQVHRSNNVDLTRQLLLPRGFSFRVLLRCTHARVQFYGSCCSNFPLVPVCGSFRCVFAASDAPCLVDGH
jgi:hypothetical protein